MLRDAGKSHRTWMLEKWLWVLLGLEAFIEFDSLSIAVRQGLTDLCH